MVLMAVAGYLIAQYDSGGRASGRCQVVSGKGDGAVYRFSAEQAVNAATISAVGTSRGMPERAVTIALATALQESGLRNIGHGDRDSLGLFQQRPSQGWGTAAQIMDPAYAAGRFYEHLAEVPGYSRLPLTVAAQRVQRSAYPQAYAKHEPDAILLSAALTGRAQAALTCDGPAGSRTGNAVKVRKALVRDFGGEVLAPAASTVPSDGRTASAPPAGKGSDRRTVTIPVRPATDKDGGSVQHGWQLAHWAVSNASALDIEEVDFAGRRWTAGDSADGWRAADRGKADGESHETGGAESSGRSGKASSDEVRIITAH